MTCGWLSQSGVNDRHLVPLPDDHSVQQHYLPDGRNVIARIPIRPTKPSQNGQIAIPAHLTNARQTLTKSKKCKYPLRISQNSSWQKTRDRTTSSRYDAVNTKGSNKTWSLPHLQSYTSSSFRATYGSRSREFFPVKQIGARLPLHRCNVCVVQCEEPHQTIQTYQYCSYFAWFAAVFTIL